jgi:esterase/lipase superfamily enzyme
MQAGLRRHRLDGSRVVRHCSAWIALILVAFLAGCGSRPEPALRLADPASATDAAVPVELFSITTRRAAEDEGLRFSGERAIGPQFARMQISIPKDRPPGEIQWPQAGRADPGAHFAAIAFEKLDRARFGERLAARIRQKRTHHVLVFVHGYNTRFDEATFRLAQIVHDSGADVVPVLFSWASWASLGAYPYDRESAALARDGLEDLLSKLAHAPQVQQVSVLAHSMGGWLTLETLRQMVIRNGAVPGKIGNVMLASPDVDIDLAAAQGRILMQAQRRPKITLFVSTDDKALSASRWLWGSRDRLGSINPSVEPYKSGLEKAGVTVIDLSAVSSGDPLNHGKFAQSPAVVQLIGRRLATGQVLDGEASGAGAIATIVQGTARAAETVLTLPLRLGETPGPQAGSLSD